MIIILKLFKSLEQLKQRSILTFSRMLRIILNMNFSPIEFSSFTHFICYFDQSFIFLWTEIMLIHILLPFNRIPISGIRLSLNLTLIIRAFSFIKLIISSFRHLQYIVVQRKLRLLRILVEKHKF